MARSTAVKKSRTGGQLFVEQLKAADVEYLFTNPGSTEAAIFDALLDAPEIKTIIGLHEGVVAGMADGYCRASGQVGVINVHGIAGTAQMAGQLYNLCRDASPIVVTAGMLDNELYTDLLGLSATPGFAVKDIVRQFVKTAWEIRNPEAIPLALRRAIKVSTTPPFGPTYLAVTNYALDAKDISATIYPRADFTIADNAWPSPKAIDEAAAMLLESKQPILFLGDEVWQSGTQAEVVELAEWLGAGVTLGFDGYRNFPVHHPNFLNALSGSRWPGTPGSYPGAKPNYDTWFRNAKIPAEADVCVAIGAKIIGGWGERDTDATARVYDKQVAIGMNTDHMARNYPVDLTILSNVKFAATELLAALKSRCTEARMKPIRDTRNQELAARSAEHRAGDEGRLKQQFDARPIHPVRLSYECQRVLPAGTIFLNENFTADHSPIAFGFRPAHNEKIWMAATGASLGWGLGAAIGAKVGAPDTPVVLSIGDGSLMYSSAGFWTMARHGIAVLVIVWNNSAYQILRYGLGRLNGAAAKTGRFPGVYLDEPAIDFVGLAKSQGVSGERVTEPSDIAAAIQRGLDATQRGEPYLLDVVLSRIGSGADSNWHETFNLHKSM